MNYLILGNGSMPKPELRAVLQEIVDQKNNPEFNVLEDRGEPGWIEQILMGEASDYGIDTFYYDGEVPIDTILLLNHESNGEDIWDLIETLVPPALVFVMNEQMVEIVPPADEEPDRPDHYSEQHDGPAEDVPDNMTVVGDEEVLDEMSLPELKRVAEGLGVTPSDWRSKDAIRKAIREAPEQPVELENDATEAQPQEKEAQDDVVLYLMTAADYLMKAAAALGGDDS